MPRCTSRASPLRAGRCTALVAKGLLSGGDLAAQQNDAKAKLKAYGWLADSDVLQAAHAGTNILVAATYAYAYGKFSVTDKVCGFTFAPTDAAGVPVAFTARRRRPASPRRTALSAAWCTRIRWAAPGLQLRRLAEHRAGRPVAGWFPVPAFAGDRCGCGQRRALTGTLAAQSARVRAGMAEVAATGNLRASRPSSCMAAAIP
jgi:hydroxybutyrate-dimer hydrolase